MESGIAGPFIGVISQLVGWIFFLIALGMFKSFISHGLSWAIGEFLFASGDQKLRERLCKWFGNGDEILKFLVRMDEKQASCQCKTKE